MKEVVHSHPPLLEKWQPKLLNLGDPLFSRRSSQFSWVNSASDLLDIYANERAKTFQMVVDPQSTQNKLRVQSDRVYRIGLRSQSGLLKGP
jgi:hypothetical protein